MWFRRVTLVLLCAFTILLSAVAALIVRQARGDNLDSTLWIHALLVFIGILILTRASFGPNAMPRDRCTRCGGPTFETSRSSDRHQVRTCFTCGNERTTPPAQAAVDVRPDAVPEKTPESGPAG